MRYELTDFEWVAIQPFLPNKPRGVLFSRTRRDGSKVIQQLLFTSCVGLAHQARALVERECPAEPFGQVPGLAVGIADHFRHPPLTRIRLPPY